MAVIVNALRTPIGKLYGTLANKKPEELAALVMKNCFAQKGLNPELLMKLS